jgi:hypothetical protein
MHLPAARPVQRYSRSSGTSGGVDRGGAFVKLFARFEQKTLEPELRSIITATGTRELAAG